MAIRHRKPLALYGRLISASSNKGDIVLDPFCGCGTTIDAAHTIKRLWMGIDVTILALDPMRQRLEDRHGLKPSIDYQIEGYPTNMQEVRKLFERRGQTQISRLLELGSDTVGVETHKRCRRWRT